MSDLMYFPTNKLEALTMLYVERQDISSLTPEQLLDFYNNTYAKIREHNHNNRQHKHSDSVSY